MIVGRDRGCSTVKVLALRLAKWAHSHTGNVANTRKRIHSVDGKGSKQQLSASSCRLKRNLESALVRASDARQGTGSERGITTVKRVQHKRYIGFVEVPDHEANSQKR